MLHQRNLTSQERNAWSGLLKRDPNEHKSQAGRLVVIGGSAGMTGAAFLAARTALFAGAGWVVLGLTATNSPAFDPIHPEVMCLNSILHEEEIKFHLSQAQTVCIGPGLGQSDHAWHWLESVLSLKCRLVLDADALNLVAQDKALKALLCSRADPSLTVITPHPGEAARLLQVDIQTIQSERLGCAKKLSEEYSSLVVLKGSGSLCVAPSVLGYNHYHCSYGNAGMGSAGMGDALTGLIGSLSAQGVAHQLDLWKASVLAVDLHARAGDVLSRMESGDTFITAMKGVDEVYSPIETPALLGLHAFELAPVIRRMLHLSLIGHR